MVLVKEEQEEVLRRRERELTALKGALKEEVSTHDQEVDKLREQYEKEIHKLQASVDEAKQVSSRTPVIKGLCMLLTAYKCLKALINVLVRAVISLQQLHSIITLSPIAKRIHKLCTPS